MGSEVLRHADIILLNEVDVGMARSENQNIGSWPTSSA